MTQAADPVAVGRVIREKREELGLEIQELASKAGVGRNTLSQIERGQRTCTGATLAKIARALNISGAQLIAESEGREDDPDFYKNLKNRLLDTASKLQNPGNIRALTALTEQLLSMETVFVGEEAPTWNVD